jgi:hypothetical protein
MIVIGANASKPGDNWGTAQKFYVSMKLVMQIWKIYTNEIDYGGSIQGFFWPKSRYGDFRCHQRLVSKFRTFSDILLREPLSCMQLS